MRKHLFVIVLILSVGCLWAEDHFPIRIERFEKHGSQKELSSVQEFRYDADTNMVESIEYQIIHDRIDEINTERKYMTEHIISEYNEQGCYHSIEYSRENWNPLTADEDTIFKCTEYFYDILDSGNKQTICLTENDSTMSLFDACCRLLGSQTFDRKTGELTDYKDVTWSSDSLQMWSVSKNERQFSRYWYDSDGEIRKQHHEYYEKRNGKWKRMSNLWQRPHYFHGFGRVDPSMVICPFSAWCKFNKDGDIISSFSIDALACLIPFFNRLFYEYEYLDNASAQKSK